jgi:hypothetical protein
LDRGAEGSSEDNDLERDLETALDEYEKLLSARASSSSTPLYDSTDPTQNQISRRSHSEISCSRLGELRHGLLLYVGDEGEKGREQQQAEEPGEMQQQEEELEGEMEGVEKQEQKEEEDDQDEEHEEEQEEEPAGAEEELAAN